MAEIIKISELPEATSLENLYTPGTDNTNRTVKVPIEMLKGNKGERGDKGDIGESGNSLSLRSLYNVSQENNNFSYIDNVAARNAVPTNLRTREQIVSYKLASGESVTEKFIGSNVSMWNNTIYWEDINASPNIVTYTVIEDKNKDIYLDNIHLIVNNRTIFPDTGLTVNNNYRSIIDKVPLKPNTVYKIVAETNISQSIYLYPSNSNVQRIRSVGNTTGNTWLFTTATTGELYLSMGIRNSSPGETQWDITNNLKIYENFTEVEDVDTKMIVDGQEISVWGMQALTASWIRSLKPLRDKKVAIYGTSIEAGTPNFNDRDTYSYMNVAVKELGGIILNYAVDGGYLIYRGGSNGGRSFMNAISGERNYQKDMLNLIGTPNEPDLFVFSFNVNDWAIGGNSQMQETNWDFTSFNTANFIGAWNQLFKDLFNVKPKAKVILLTHFSDDKHPEGQDVFKDTNKTVKAVADFWQIPCIEMQKHCCIMNRNGTNNKIVYCPDGIHPGTNQINS